MPATVERAIERIIEAETDAGLRPDDDPRDERHEAYERTFRALEDATPTDDDEGIVVVTEWIIEQVQTTGERPGSQAVQRRARHFCEYNGHDVDDSDWLGV